jgi:glycosyltransferase involved in cell wall biosynthesis
MSKDNAITYCHFPSAKYHIDSENLEYLRDVGAAGFLRIPYIDFFSYNGVTATNLLGHDTKQKVKKYFEFLRHEYESLMRNTLVLANSEYTRRAIYRIFNVDPKILYPPVDVETFREAALQSTFREDLVLVISRIAPDKQIQNAIELAKILRRKGIAKSGMVIAGNLYHYNYDYYQHLRKMIADSDLSNYISLQTNISFIKLLQLMQLAKVYFHPRIDEHFGISIVEAMASGLVPVVSNMGGQAEFVPSKYCFSTLDQAAQIMASGSEATQLERAAISDSTTKFSNANYIKSFHLILSELSELLTK